MTPKQIAERKEKLAAILAEQRALNDKVAAEKRDMNAEETASWEKMEADYRAVAETVKREEMLLARQREADEAALRSGAAKPLGEGERREERADPAADGYVATREYREKFFKALRRGRVHAYGDDGVGLRVIGPNGERRALSVGSDAQAGYLVMPEETARGIVGDLAKASVFRTIANVRPPLRTAMSTGIRKRTARMSSAAWGTELGAPTADTALAYGKKVLWPHPSVGEILVSRDLLQLSDEDIEGEIRAELARDSAYLEEQAFISGDGDKKPLGVFTASSDGISTGQDRSTDATTTAPTFDALISIVGALRPPYRPGARFLWHPDCSTLVRKLKDGNGQYIWQQSVQAGQPDRVLGFPVTESEFAPNTFTTGLYYTVFGDFRMGYSIQDGLDYGVQALTELYARTNQVDFLWRKNTDGLPVLEEAFIRGKLA